MAKDLTIFENGNGGEISLLNKDISYSQSIYYRCYLAMFGGNTEASTKGNELEGEIRLDWWGNQLLFSENKSNQFNSETERVLKEVVLNSAGRISILRAVENDLKFLKNIAEISVNVVILNSSKMSIEIKLREPKILGNSSLKILWDNAKLENITIYNI